MLTNPLLLPVVTGNEDLVKAFLSAIGFNASGDKMFKFEKHEGSQIGGNIKVVEFALTVLKERLENVGKPRPSA